MELIHKNKDVDWNKYKCIDSVYTTRRHILLINFMKQ